MNWVAPIKDKETLIAFENALKKTDLKYYIMFKIGVGTGIQLQDILQFRASDLKGKDKITVSIGVRQMEREYKFPKDLTEAIEEYCGNMAPDEYVFRGHKANAPLTREQAYRALKATSLTIGISSIGAQTMRKTFAWNYYKETGDIYYLQQLFNHASPTITYRFIGEKPSVDIPMRKLTSSENERCRKELCKNGSSRIDNIKKELTEIEKDLKDPSMPDAFYGTVDCLLSQIEEILEGFHNTVE